MNEHCCINSDFTSKMKLGKNMNSHRVRECLFPSTRWQGTPSKTSKVSLCLGFKAWSHQVLKELCDRKFSPSVTTCRHLVLPGKASFTGRKFSLFAYPHNETEI